MFSVYVFATNPEKLREKLASDASLAPEIARRAKHRHGASHEEIDELGVRIIAVRSLNWPVPSDYLSVNAFLWMLDYAAEPIIIGRLRDIRDASLVDEIPLLDEMMAVRGPLPLPDVSGLDCDIGFLKPQQLRELAERGPPRCANPHLDVGTELVEVFQSLADDDLGLYASIDGAKFRRRQAIAIPYSRTTLLQLVKR